MRKVPFLIIITIALSACGRKDIAPPSQISLPSPSKIPPSFAFTEEFTDDEFLFVYLFNDDYTCLDGLCNCLMLEAPAEPFEFRDGKLILNQYFFDPVPAENWKSLRRNNTAIALYANWVQWDSHLQMISGFPFKTPMGDFLILGANPQGDIQIMIDQDYAIVRSGSNYQDEQPEQKSDDCKIMNKFTLYNYGFISDDNVEYLYIE